MITQRQKELATYFDNLRIGDFEFSEEWSGPRLDEDGNVTLISCFAEYVGPWLGADWCWEFLISMQDQGTIGFNFYTSENTVTVLIPFSETTGTAKKGFLKHLGKGTFTERMQESVKQVIEWFPEESLQIIKSILHAQPQTHRP